MAKNSTSRRGLLQWMIEKASRDTTSGQFIAEIDGLRFIAIFSVIFYHMCDFVTVKTGRPIDGDPLIIFFSHGSVGVKLFFVISGFVIALPFAKAHLNGGQLPRIQQYFIRRFTRLEPPYFVNLIIRFILLTLLTTKTATDLLPHLFASMGYLHNIIYGKQSEINVVAWSLEVELQFYVLAPILAKVYMINSKWCRRGLLLVLIGIFSTISYLNGGVELSRYSLSVLAAAQFFLTGFLLVDVYLIELINTPIKTFVWDFVSVLSWISICILVFLELGRFFIVIPIFIAYYSAFRGIWSNWFFRRPLIYIIGGMCYTIYLYHFSIINTAGLILIKSGLIDHVPLWLAVTIANIFLVPVIIFVCTLLFVFIEKPCMKKDWYVRLFKRIKSGLRIVMAS